MIKMIQTDNLLIQFDHTKQHIQISTSTQALSLSLQAWIELKMIIDMIDRSGD